MGDVLAIVKFFAVVLVMPFMFLFGAMIVASSIGGVAGHAAFVVSAFLMLAIGLWLVGRANKKQNLEEKQ